MTQVYFWLALLLASVRLSSTLHVKTNTDRLAVHFNSLNSRHHARLPRTNSPSTSSLFSSPSATSPSSQQSPSDQFPADQSPNLVASASLNPHDDVIRAHLDELIALRETPELVDKLENLVQKYPGIELNINLYRAIYPFPLDTFQENGLLSLMTGNSVLVSTP
jgi:superfamily II RNA helicase